MPALINVDNLTLNPREAETVAKVIFKRIFEEGELSEFHEIETGVDMKTQIVFAGNIGLLGKASTGCTPNDAGGFSLSQKYWDPAREDFRLKHCQADMKALLKLFAKAKRMNPDFFDQIGSEEFGIIISAVENAMIENLHRKAWFNDKAAALIADGGVFKPGTDLGYWNTFDGLFKQIFAEVPTTASNYVQIAKNVGASYAAQALAADDAYGVFVKIVNTADDRLLNSGEAVILTTRSLADNYRDTLRNKNLGSGYLEVVENGRPKLYFDGYEVKVRGDWDRYIKSYQDNGTKWNLPHRAVFTTKANIPLGTLSEDDLKSLDVFYDKTLKTNIIDAVYTIDAKHLEDYMTVAAY